MFQGCNSCVYQKCYNVGIGVTWVEEIVLNGITGELHRSPAGLQGCYRGATRLLTLLVRTVTDVF